MKVQEPDVEKLRQLFTELEFSSFLNKFESKINENTYDYKIIDDTNYDFTKLTNSFIDIEVFGSNYLKGEFRSWNNK